MPRWLYLISVYLHILAVLTWLGGMIFVSLVAVPALRAMRDPPLQARVLTGLGRRFRNLGWIAIGLLVVTGTLNAVGRWGWQALTSPEFWGAPAGQTLGWKLALVGLMMALSALHDFRLGPRLTAARRSGAPSETIERQRRRASWLARVNLLLGLVVVALAVILVRS